MTASGYSSRKPGETIALPQVIDNLLYR